MNSPEQEDFGQQPPTSVEIEETMRLITAKLEHLQHNASEHEGLIEGYKEAIEILTRRKNDYELISQDLKTLPGKTVAVLAVNYLNGECSRAVLMGGE